MTLVKPRWWARGGEVAPSWRYYRRRLVGAWPMIEGGGAQVRDFVGNAHATRADSFAEAVWELGPHGFRTHYLDGELDTNVEEVGGCRLFADAGAPFTIWTRADWSGGPVGYMFSRAGNTLGLRKIGLYDNSSTGNLECIIRGSTTTLVSSGDFEGLRTFCITWDGLSTARFYMDGLLLDEPSVGSGSDGALDIKFGARTSAFQADDAYQDLIYIWDECLPPSMIAGLEIDPCGFWRHSTRGASVFVPVAVTSLEGFRGRDDNGSETTADWLAAQDTNLTVSPGVNFRLRTILANPPDAASQRTLQFAVDGTEDWFAPEPE